MIELPDLIAATQESLLIRHAELCAQKLPLELQVEAIEDAMQRIEKELKRREHYDKTMGSL